MSRRAREGFVAAVAQNAGGRSGGRNSARLNWPQITKAYSPRASHHFLHRGGVALRAMTIWLKVLGDTL